MKTLIPLLRGQPTPTPRKETRRKGQVSETSQGKKYRGTDYETFHPNPGN